MRVLRMPLLAAGIAVILIVPGLALAQTAAQPGSATPAPQYAPDTPASLQTTDTYDLTFTLPTAGKSGCMVCHGDPNLVRISGGETVSMWVNPVLVESSAHANVQCTGCHLDFAYTVPHANTKNEAWRDVAKSACKNCHKEAFSAYGRGGHSPTPTPSGGTTATAAATSTVSVASTDRKPLCGDCHGSHDIQPLKGNPDGQEAMHARGKEICGDCHTVYWENYDDSYHGAAYKRGAEDAPACWNCHGAHAVLPSSDRRSTVSEANLVDMCSRCHLNQPNEEYASYSVLVHGRKDIYEENPIVALWQEAIGIIQSWFD